MYLLVVCFVYVKHLWVISNALYKENAFIVIIVFQLVSETNLCAKIGKLPIVFVLPKVLVYYNLLSKGSFLQAVPSTSVHRCRSASGQDFPHFCWHNLVRITNWCYGMPTACP